MTDKTTQVTIRIEDDMSLSVRNVCVVVLVSPSARLCRVIVTSIAPYDY